MPTLLPSFPPFLRWLVASFALCAVACGGSSSTNGDERPTGGAGTGATEQPPDANRCGSLAWVRTVDAPIPRETPQRAIVGVTADPSKKEISLLLASGPTCGADPALLYVMSDDGVEQSVEPIVADDCLRGVAHDGTRLLSIASKGASRTLVDIRKPKEPLLALPSSLEAQELGIGGDQAWFRSHEGLVSVPFPAGGDFATTPLERVGSANGGPVVGLAWSDAGLWSARVAFESGMRNYLYLARTGATKGDECAFYVEDAEGLTGKQIEGITARGREVFVFADGKMATFAHR